MEVKYVKRDENMAGHLFSKLGSGQKPITHGIFFEHLRIPSVKGANPDDPERGYCHEMGIRLDLASVAH
jgi:hypothetical protein